jgi:hypothetical protein
MKVKIIILTLMSLLLACKKEDEANSSSGEVKLQVTEYGSNAPIKKAFVGLLKRTSNGIGSSASYEVLQSGVTDSNGYVNFGNYSSWNNLYIDVQHPDYYDISTISYEQVKNQQSKIVLAGVSVVGVKFFNTYNKDKPETILSYGFDPYRGGGGHPPLINITDTIEHFFYIPALHYTNVRYTLFENMDKYDIGMNYLQGVLFPFITAKTSDTANIIVNY